MYWFSLIKDILFGHSILEGYKRFVLDPPSVSGDLYLPQGNVPLEFSLVGECEGPS